MEIRFMVVGTGSVFTKEDILLNIAEEELELFGCDDLEMLFDEYLQTGIIREVIEDENGDFVELLTGK